MYRRQCRRPLSSSVSLRTLRGNASGSPPHAQGLRIAQELRHYIGLKEDERLDIFGLVQSIGVEVQAQPAEPDTFDGLAVAGGRYGPGAFLNIASKRFSRWNGVFEENGSVRITLAHELCHLLVDRDHPLSAVEVLRSRMPAGVESRARAFAGEFLLPTAAANSAWRLADAPFAREPLRIVLQDLAASYGVSISVAAWKVEQAFAYGSGWRRLRASLDEIAPNR